MAKGTIVPAENITVSNRSQGKLDKLKAEFPSLHTTTHNLEAAEGADMVILAVKPWLIIDLLKELQLPANTLIVSVAAGISCNELLACFDNKKQTIFRVVPNTAISELQSMTLICGCNATDEQWALMHAIFNEMGATVALSEAKLGAGTSLASCGIAYALKYIQAAMQAGIEMGLYPKDAAKMVAQSLIGAGQLILHNETHPSAEIDKVCTPGGYTIKGINELEHNGFSSAIIQAMKASKCQ